MSEKTPGGGLGKDPAPGGGWDRATRSATRVLHAHLWSSAIAGGHPLQELAGLDLKELTQLIEGLGMEAAKPPAGTGEPVGAGVSQIGAQA